MSHVLSRNGEKRMVKVNSRAVRCSTMINGAWRNFCP